MIPGNFFQEKEMFFFKFHLVPYFSDISFNLPLFLQMNYGSLFAIGHYTRNKLGRSLNRPCFYHLKDHLVPNSAKLHKLLYNQHHRC